MTENDICYQAIKKFGTENQTRKAVEELTELSLALQRALDGRADMDNIREEIADVEIMCEQLRTIFDSSVAGLDLTINEWKSDKLYRLEKLVSQE